MFNHNPFHGGKIAKAATQSAVVLTLLLAPIIFGAQAEATTNNPDSTPTASAIHINRNLINTGDELIFGEINIPYKTPPDDSADKTYILRILSADKNTEYGYALLYSYFTRGYNYNVFAFYFDPAHAPTWNVELYLRISQNPAYFSSPVNTDIDIPTTDYTTLTDPADNQTELAQKLVPIVDEIGNRSGLELLTVSGGYTILNGQGELFMRGAINGIQMMAPDLFLVQNLALDYTNATWNTTQFDTYENRFNGTWVGDDVTATGEQFGMPPTMIMSFIFTLPLALGAVVFTSIKFKHTDPGLMVVALLLIMSVQMGFLPKAVFASIYQACGIYVAYLWFYARS